MGVMHGVSVVHATAVGKTLWRHWYGQALASASVFASEKAAAAKHTASPHTLENLSRPVLDLVTFTMYCQPLLDRSPGNQMALLMAALLMSDDKDTVSSMGPGSRFQRKLLEVVGRDIVTNTVLMSTPQRGALRLSAQW